MSNASPVIVKVGLWVQPNVTYKSKAASAVAGIVAQRLLRILRQYSRALLLYPLLDGRSVREAYVVREVIVSSGPLEGEVAGASQTLAKVHSLHQFARLSVALKTLRWFFGRGFEASLFPWDQHTNAQLQYYSSAQLVAKGRRKDSERAHAHRRKMVRQTRRRVLTLDCMDRATCCVAMGQLRRTDSAQSSSAVPSSAWQRDALAESDRMTPPCSNFLTR